MAHTRGLVIWLLPYPASSPFPLRALWLPALPWLLPQGLHALCSLCTEGPFSQSFCDCLTSPKSRVRCPSLSIKKEKAASTTFYPLCFCFLHSTCVYILHLFSLTYNTCPLLSGTCSFSILCLEHLSNRPYTESKLRHLLYE